MEPTNHSDLAKPEILTVLDNARTAHQAGDFANALQFYQTFFDHALDHDPFAFYAIRLSHCLESWADLALVFPGAKQALEQQQRKSLSEYKQFGVPEKFHDYWCISQQLGQNERALEEFLGLHIHAPNDSAKLVKYVWDELVEAEYWTVCSELMEQPTQKLDELFSIFDESAKLREIDPSFNNLQFENHTIEQLFSGTTKICLVLRHSQRKEELRALERQFYSSIENRNNSSLHKQAHARSSYMFSGH